jgi:hypothetical protein
MTTEILNPDENNPENRIVRLGSGHEVSMQVIQDLYNKLTGKSEKLTRTFRLNHTTTYEDICQLNTKITQLYEQYNIKGHNCTITLFHVNDSAERFSSFEKFQSYDSSSLSPIENMLRQ